MTLPLVIAVAGAVAHTAAGVELVVSSADVAFVPSSAVSVVAVVAAVLSVVAVWHYSSHQVMAVAVGTCVVVAERVHQDVLVVAVDMVAVVVVASQGWVGVDASLIVVMGRLVVA